MAVEASFLCAQTDVVVRSLLLRPDPLPSAALLAMDSNGNLRPGLVASAIIGAPWELPALIRLGLSTRIARKRLTELASLGLGRSFFAHFGDE